LTHVNSLKFGQKVDGSTKSIFSQKPSTIYEAE